MGYAVNGLEKEEIRKFLSRLTKESYEEKIRNLKRIPREDVINVNPEMFKYISEIL